MVGILRVVMAIIDDVSSKEQNSQQKKKLSRRTGAEGASGHQRRCML